MVFKKTGPPSMQEFEAWKSKVPEDEQKKELARYGHFGGTSAYEAYKIFMSPGERGRRAAQEQDARDRELAEKNTAFFSTLNHLKKQGGSDRPIGYGSSRKAN